MAASISQLRLALQAALEQIDDLPAHDIWPGQVTPPAALVRPTSISYAEAFDGLTQYFFEVVLVVRNTNLRSGQEQLDEYVSPSGDRSVQTAVELDQTLGGISDIVNVARAHDYGELFVGEAKYLGVIFDVEIWAS